MGWDGQSEHSRKNTFDKRYEGSIRSWVKGACAPDWWGGARRGLGNIENKSGCLKELKKR